MNDKELNYKEVWDGLYKGVRLEVVKWRLGWNYYLYIPISQIPTDVHVIFNLRGKKDDFGGREVILYDYASKPIISDLDWHGGITFYEKVRGSKGEVEGYKLGCDYLHLWDEGKSYFLEYVLDEAKHSIDKLWEYVPNLKVRCAYNGNYYPVEEIYYNEYGVSIAKVNKENWETPIGKEATNDTD